MKKTTVFLLLILSLLALFSACQSSSYRISVTGESDLLSEALPKRAKAGETIEIRTHVIMDCDIIVTVNGVKIQKSHYDSDYWGYTFTMPSEDVTVTLTTEDGFLSPAAPLLLTDLVTWLGKLRPENVLKIQKVSTNSGVAPGTLMHHRYTTDREAIARILGIYQNIQLEKSNENILPPGGSTITIRFVLHDGTVHALHSYSGMFIKNNVHYVMHGDTSFIVDEITGTALSFVTYAESCEVYELTNPESAIGHFNGIKDLTFIPYTGDIPDTDPVFRLDTDFCDLFVLTERLFYIDVRDTRIYYNLTEGNFNELLSFPD